MKYIDATLFKVPDQMSDRATSYFMGSERKVHAIRAGKEKVSAAGVETTLKPGELLRSPRHLPTIMHPTFWDSNIK